MSPEGTPAEVDAVRQRLTDRLVAARNADTDSPVFQLVEGFPEIDRLKTDVFRAQAEYSAGWKERLARYRRDGLEAVRRAEQELGELRDVLTQPRQLHVTCTEESFELRAAERQVPLLGPVADEPGHPQPPVVEYRPKR